MPRFAANLGFGPLEPLKPTKFTADTSSSRNSKATSSGSSEKPSTSTNDVPAVKFDWNSSGLVNPLDGMLLIFYSYEVDFTLNMLLIAFSSGENCFKLPYNCYTATYC